VEDVKTDHKSHIVLVKGKTADPIKVCERIQKKSGRKVEIISPLPKPPEEKKEEVGEKKGQKEEPPPVLTLVLKINMHCEACCQVLQKRIRVESVETDLMNNQVVVKGILDPTTVVESVYKKTRKQAFVVPQEEKKEEEKKVEEKKQEEEKKEEAKKQDEKKEEGDSKTDVKKSEYWPPKYYIEYAYPPEIFSDENPNACSVM
ncbi:hypothetical protein IFM89_003532, partial [Coptis chinensis]